MTDEELLGLSREILVRMEADGEGDKDVLWLRMQVLRIVSHIRSEQRVTRNLGNEMLLLSRAIFGNKEKPNEPGLVESVREIKENMAINRRIHAAIASGVGMLILKSVYDVITHLKP